MRALTLLLLTALLGLPSAVRAKETGFPYRLAVEVSFAEGVGSESVRGMLEREVLRELDLGECFESARLAADVTDERGAGDLLLRVVVVGVERETVYDLSMAERNSPDAGPDAADRYTTRVEASVRFDLLTAADRLLLRDKEFHVIGSHRPEGGEDARAVARQEMIDEVASTARYWSCKGSAKKLARRIDDLRSSR